MLTFYNWDSLVSYMMYYLYSNWVCIFPMWSCFAFWRCIKGNSIVRVHCDNSQSRRLYEDHVIMSAFTKIASIDLLINLRPHYEALISPTSCGIINVYDQPSIRHCTVIWESRFQLQNNKCMYYVHVCKEVVAPHNHKHIHNIKFYSLSLSMITMIKFHVI